MENILSQLYRGEIHPQETYKPCLPELLEERKIYLEHQAALIASLDAETGGRVLELLEERNYVSAYEMEDSYIQGMKMGARMAAELLMGTEKKE